MPTLWTVCPARVAQRPRQVRYAVGQWQKGVPLQSARRLGCGRQTLRLADRRASRSIADTRISPQYSNAVLY
ncbi:MAG: hypothetical protein OXC69_02855 [Candidatus Tectomicrobia bacterium]|nr:hypothetical protein [Candidatus Tectomicrobia bacterium]